MLNIIRVDSFMESDRRRPELPEPSNPQQAEGGRPAPRATHEQSFFIFGHVEERLLMRQAAKETGVKMEYLTKLSEQVGIAYDMPNVAWEPEYEAVGYRVFRARGSPEQLKRLLERERELRGMAQGRLETPDELRPLMALHERAGQVVFRRSDRLDAREARG
jgi:hypothetical protein